MEQAELVVLDALHVPHRARLRTVVAMSVAMSVALSTVGASCGGSREATVVSLPLPAPDGGEFYVPLDPVPGTENGELIWSRQLDSAPFGTAAWQVLYRSESLAGEAIAVSGVVVGPATPSTTARPVLTWAHGTTGLADRCAPSKSYPGAGAESLLAQAAVLFGYTFVATDYEGLGTPGVHPFLVGQSEGRGVLDIVRAAAGVEGVGVTSESPVAIFGHSQGGQAALMAAEMAPTYAPELNVVGSVAGAPPGDLNLIEAATGDASGMAGGGFGLMMDAGFVAAYPDLPADALVTDDGLDVLDQIGDSCTSGAFELAAENPDIDLDGTSNADWRDAFDANSPGGVAPTVPVLIVHGSADQVVPPALSEQIAADYCGLGVTVQRTEIPTADHGTVLTMGLAEIQSWIAARFAGAQAPSNC